MNAKDAIALFSRYFILILIALPGLAWIYWLFTKPTLYLSLFLLKLFYPSATTLFGSGLFVNGYLMMLIPACIAGSAYYLLLILNLSTPMPILKRIKSLFFLIGSFLILNSLRIVFFSYFFIEGYSFFDSTHKFFWYFGSTILVVLIWFLNVSLFKIKAIPAYTDLNSFYKELKRR